MPILLTFASGPQAGRRLTIDEGHPRLFKIVKHGAEAGTVVVEVVDGQCVATNRSQRPLLVNGQERQRSVVVEGDELVIGKDTFRVQVEGDPDTRSFTAPEVEEPAIDERPTVAVTADGSQRRRRSLSAESGSQASEPRQGLLSRVSTALATRAERGREEELQRQRQELLAQVGRRALAGERFGLPAQAVNDLLAGRHVHLAPGSVDQAALGWWRATRDQLALLDAEITALRQAIGLGPDAAALPTPVARQEQRQQEERTFSALDGLRTQPLEGVDEQAPTVAVAASSTSGRRRVPLSRRR